MKKPHPRRHRVLLCIVLVLLCLVAEGRFGLETTEYSLCFSALPAAFDGLRILQLSDLHGAVFGRDNGRLLRAAAAAKPDLIAITGDLADGHTDLQSTDTLLAGLVQIAPVYFVSGNHEWSAGLTAPLQVLFQRHGVRWLRNEAVTLERGGEAILLAGVEDPNGYRDMQKPDALVAALREAYPEAFLLLLGHRNDWPEKYPALPVDLILCGHAHGGVIRLPGLGGLIGTDRTLFPKNTAGVCPCGNARMLVSRGLGNSPHWLPRLCNTPQLVVLTLRTDASSAGAENGRKTAAAPALPGRT